VAPFKMAVIEATSVAVPIRAPAYICSCPNGTSPRYNSPVSRRKYKAFSCLDARAKY